ALPGPNVPFVAKPAVNTTITIDDSNGFQPATLSIQAGQTVTWTNNGLQVHSAVGNPTNVWYLVGSAQTFDSGGINPGTSFSVTFNTKGTFGYRSLTETPAYTNSTTASGNVVPIYPFNGVIVVG